MNKILYYLIITAVFVLFTSCTKISDVKDTGKSNLNVVDKYQENNKTIEDNFSEKDRIDTIIDSMTLEEKAGQLLMLAFRKNSKGENLYEIDEYTKKCIQDIKPGGIAVFSQNIKTINQTKNLIQSFQETTQIPLFIAVDEEGGLVDRLGASGVKKQRFPNNIEVGNKMDSELAYELGRAIAEEIASLGFNMNFAPVADVNTNPKNPVIGKRSFGSNQQTVAEMVIQEVRGMQDINISSVIKHFPGHGDTSTDSHTGEVIINHKLDRLESIEYVPFKAGITVGVDAIMTAHIRTPNISDNNYPATLNKDIITGQLRQKLGYSGLIITDAMEMGAISNYYSTKEAVVLALEAGVDIVLMPVDAYEARESIVEAVNNGTLSEDRINESLKRILQTKLFRGVLDRVEYDKDPNEVIDSDDHIKLINKIIEGE